MKQQKVGLIHSVFWLVFVLPISCMSIFMFQFNPELIWIFYPDATMDYVIMDAFYNIVGFGVSFYLFYFLIFEWVFHQFSSKNLVKSIGLFFFLYMAEMLLMAAIYPKELVYSDLILGGGITVFVWLLFRLGLALGIRALIEFTNERAQRKKLEQFNFQSELSLFRAQVNPHFLFNTLNNIDALIYTNPDQASATLIKLSKQMRYMLYDSNVAYVDLALEIEFIRNYIDLEAIRLSNKNFVLLDLDGDFGGIKIAPMLFIAFIENAFKHGSNKQNDEGLIIRLRKAAGLLHFECKNDYESVVSTAKIKYSGIGLDLVQKRLKLIYGDSYELEISDANNCYHVKLRLPLVNSLYLESLKQAEL